MAASSNASEAPSATAVLKKFVNAFLACSSKWSRLRAPGNENRATLNQWAILCNVGNGPILLKKAAVAAQRYQ